MSDKVRIDIQEEWNIHQLEDFIDQTKALQISYLHERIDDTIWTIYGSFFINFILLIFIIFMLLMR